MNALKERALSVLSDTSIDPQSRATIRHAMEINDPWLAKLVRRAEAEATIVDTNSGDSSDEKIGPLVEMICRGGEESAAALLVLMATLENSTDPKALAHAAKHLAFTRCGELNAYGTVDAQIAVIESHLLS